MTCNHRTCRVCNVDPKRLCLNEIAARKSSLIPKMRLKGKRSVQTEFSTISGNFGKWCRNGICPVINSGCQCKPVYHWRHRRNSK